MARLKRRDGMAPGPAQELLRSAAAAPQRQELWRAALASLPEATDVLEMVASDALRRHFGQHGPLPPRLSAGLRENSPVVLVQATKARRFAWFSPPSRPKGPRFEGDTGLEVEAYAALRVRDDPVMLALQQRSLEMAKHWQSLQILKGRGVAELLDAFGKLASRGDATGRRAQGRAGAQTSERLRKQLSRLCVSSAGSMRAPTACLRPHLGDLKHSVRPLGLRTEV